MLLFKNSFYGQPDIQFHSPTIFCVVLIDLKIAENSGRVNFIYLAVHKMNFRKKHRDLKFLWNILLDHLNRPLHLSQTNVTSRALASSGLSACGKTQKTAAEIDVTFDFAIYLCSQKNNRKTERSKNVPKLFSLMLTFYNCGTKFMLF